MSEGQVIDVVEVNGVWYVRRFLRGELRFVKVKSFRSYREALACVEKLKSGGVCG